MYNFTDNIMEKLYSYKGTEPSILPNRIRLSNGLTKTNKEEFTQDDLKDAGYTEITQLYPAFLQTNEKVVWNSNDLRWDVVALSESERLSKIQKIASIVREERDSALKKSDIDVIRQVELTGVVSEALRAYRQSLRDLPLQPEFPLNVSWPELKDN